VLTDARGVLPGAIRGWPPPRFQLARLPGVTLSNLATHVGWADGATSRHIGSWRIDAFNVTYQVGGYLYSATVRQGIDVRTVRTCPFCRSDHQLDGRLGS